MGTIGPRLRAAREARNLSVEQAADDTRIALRFLQALEREEFDALPAPVYVRGFLRSYANYLGLEPQSLLSELEGEVAGPAAFVRGPANGNNRPAARTATDPFRPRPAALPATPGEWDPEPDAPAPLPAPYIEPVREYRPRPVPGVLTERGYSGPPSRLPAFVLVGGIGAIVVLVALIAMVALGGDDEPTLPAGADDDSDTTPTVQGGQTIVVVETPTTTAGAGDGTSTASAGETPADGATPTPEGTAATATPAVQPTATITPTATPTSPPTATPTFTPQPTPSATVQPHPFGTSECTAGGGTNCGDPPFRVICAPDGWFVDKDRDYPKPPDWFEFDVNMTFGIDGVAEATCG